MRKDKLNRFQQVMREQRDFLDNTAPTLPDFKTDEGYVKREAEINSLSAWLAADQQHQERASQFDHEAQTRNDNRAGEDPKEVELRGFVNYITRGDTNGVVKVRANMASNGTTTGGYLVPTVVSAAVIQDLAAMETVRRLGAQVIEVAGNTNVPIFEDAAANFIQEANSITATDPTVARVQIQPNLLVCRTSFSWQLENRSAANIVDQLRGSFARGIAKKEAAKFLYGGGTNEPAGLVAGVSATSATASVSTFTAAELLGCFWALDPFYANNGTWVMSPQAASIARTLESTNGALLWYSNLSTGNETLMGRPVVIDANMDAVTGGGGKKPVVFVDVPSAYIIGEEVGLTFLRDDYTAAGTGEVKMYLSKFVDGRVKKSAAGKALLMKAS